MSSRISHDFVACSGGIMGADHLADTEWAQAAVRTDVVVPITQPQFDALVSLA